MIYNTPEDRLNHQGEEREPDWRLEGIREKVDQELAWAGSRYHIGVLGDIAPRLDRVADCLEQRGEDHIAALEGRTRR